MQGNQQTDKESTHFPLPFSASCPFSIRMARLPPDFRAQFAEICGKRNLAGGLPLHSKYVTVDEAVFVWGIRFEVK